MATYRITAPNGGTYEITAPDDATEEQVLAYAQQNYQQANAPAIERKAEDDPSLWEGGRVPSTDPTEGMTGPQKFWAGVGASLHQTKRGLGQLAGRYSQEEIDAAAADESALMRTGAGIGGNIVGHGLQVIIPAGTAIKAGAAAPRAAAIGRTLLAPKTVATGAGIGAAQSFIQPVATGDSRAMNTTIGGLAGAGGVLVPRLIGAAVRRVVPSFTRGMQERQAANALVGMAENPSTVRNALAATPNAGVLVPGSIPTLAEMTGDVGLAGLQRTVQAGSPQFANRLATIGNQNNAARLNYLRSAFGGADETAAQAAESARDKLAAPLLREAQTKLGVDTIPVYQMIDNLVLARQGRPAVQQSLMKVRKILEEFSAHGDIGDIRRLHNVRQSIGDMLAGSAGAESDAARAATRELLLVRNVLDAQMARKSPEFAQWLRTFREGSREADRVRVGADLLKKGSPVANSLGDPVLSPHQFSRAADDMDALVRRVTRFPKARAATTLTQDQLGAIDNVRNDLARFANVQREGRAVGSNTVQNVVGLGRIQDMTGPIAAGALTGDPTSALAVAGLNAVRKKFGEQVFGMVEDALADPTRAAAILARLPDGTRQEVARQIAPLLKNTPAAYAASMAAAGYPLIDQALDIGTVSGYDRTDPRYQGD